MVIMIHQNNSKLNFKQPVIFLSTLFIMLFVTMANQVLARTEMEFSPSISLGAGYSDNVVQNGTNLNLDPTAKKSSAIAKLSPAIKISKQGARIKTKLDYRLDAYAYSNKLVTNKANTRHNLKALMQSELVKNNLFLDLDASIAQNLINKRRSDISNPSTGINNLTETYSFGVTPYWKSNWGNYAKSLLSYDYNELKYNNSNNNIIDPLRGLTRDSKQHRANFLLKNKDPSQKISWKIDLNYNEIFYKGVDDTKAVSALGEMGYAINNNFIVSSKVGYEEYNENKYVVNSDGTFYGLGFNWKAFNNATLDASIGRRFYGNAYNLNFKYTGNGLGFNFRYNENITNSRDRLRSKNGASFEETEGDSIDLISINKTNTNLYLSKKYTAVLSYKQVRLTSQVGAYHDRRSYEQKKKFRNEIVKGAFFSINYQLRKSKYQFRTYYENRDSAQFTEEGIDYGVNLLWNLQVGKRMNSLTSIRWINQKYDIRQQNNNEWLLKWDFNRRLSRNLLASLSLSHQQRLSNVKLNEFNENIIFLSLNKKFR